jgi:hypothetical protein
MIIVPGSGWVSMSTDAIEALSFFGGVAVSLWAAAFAWVQWLKHRFDEDKPRAILPSFDPERISRLELAVEALAVELERIGEGQRYTVKLLEERLPPALASGRPAQQGEAGRIVTPH